MNESHYMRNPMTFEMESEQSTYTWSYGNRCICVATSKLQVSKHNLLLIVQ